MGCGEATSYIVQFAIKFARQAVHLHCLGEEQFWLPLLVLSLDALLDAMTCMEECISPLHYEPLKGILQCACSLLSEHLVR